MAAEPKRELFISYGREPEVNKFVHRLKADLESDGFTVWLDTKDIPAGSDWHGAIGSGLERCRAIIPILTSKYIGSRYCVNELYTADSDRKLIFPIMFEDVDFSSSEAGPGIKFVISSVNWTMCRPNVDDYNNSISKLMHSMKEKGLGVGGDDDNDHYYPTHAPPTAATPSEQLIVGPSSIKPFKVIPDVENPECITTNSAGNLIVSVIQHKVLIFNPDHEKVMEIGKDPGISPGQFLSPDGVAVDSDGNILVASHYFVQKFSPTGQFLQQAGGTNPEVAIESPRGLAIGQNGRIYVAEQLKNQVTIFNPDLSLYKRFTNADKMLGSGHLSRPQGVAVNSKGDVYVADMMNNAVQVFNSEGEFQFRFGKMGTGPGCTTAPSALTIDSSDNVYVGTGGSLICIFDAAGQFVRSFGEYGSEVGQFSTIRALHIDCREILYVGEWQSNRIQLFHVGDSGSSVRKDQPSHRIGDRGTGGGQKQEVIFAKPASNSCQRAGSNVPVHLIECKNQPNSIAVSRNGNIVLSTTGSALYVFNKEYELIVEREVDKMSNCCIVVDDSNDTIIAASVLGFEKLDMELNELTSSYVNKNPDLEGITFPYAMAIGKEGQLYIAGVDQSYIVNPNFTICKIFAKKYQSFGISVSSQGYVYLSIQKENTIRVFTPDGDPLYQFGEPGRSPLPHFSLPCPMALILDHDNDNVYVATGMKCVNVFDKDGKFLRTFSDSGSEPGQYEDLPSSLCISSSGLLFVGEKDPSRIQVYSLKN